MLSWNVSPLVMLPGGVSSSTQPTLVTHPPILVKPRHRIVNRVHDRLHARDGRDVQPSAAVLASRSAPSAEDGEALGYDADNRIRGRKHHLLIETGGLLLRNVVHSASVKKAPARSCSWPTCTRSSRGWSWSGPMVATPTSSTPG